MIAEAIQGAVNYEQNFNNNEAGAEALQKFSVMLSALLMADNDRFDRARFLVACGVN
jgi:hypothetical protein